MFQYNLEAAKKQNAFLLRKWKWNRREQSQSRSRGSVGGRRQGKAGRSPGRTRRRCRPMSGDIYSRFKLDFEPLFSNVFR